MSIRDDVLFSLKVHGDIEFIYQNEHYYIGYNNHDENSSDEGYVILKSPDQQVAINHSSDWTDALEKPIFDGKSIDDVFDQIEFITLT